MRIRSEELGIRNFGRRCLATLIIDGVGTLVPSNEMIENKQKEIT